ncbi:MAG TPA: pilin [Candidatus Udaeobacter sp.]|nr:pilin [Candidatus Udaeobacter sp.]
MRALKKVFIILAILGVTLPHLVLAEDFGLKDAAQGTNLINTKSTPAVTIPELIGNVVGVALSFVGGIFFILVLYAGFLWMTAFGVSDKAEKAKDILLHAAIGLAIVLAAYAISSFVFSSLTQVTSSGSTSSSGSSNRCITDLGGVCQDTSIACSGAGGYIPGACPGAANIQCCVP